MEKNDKVSSLHSRTSRNSHLPDSATSLHDFDNFSFQNPPLSMLAKFLCFSTDPKSSRLSPMCEHNSIIHLIYSHFYDNINILLYICAN